MRRRKKGARFLVVQTWSHKGEKCVYIYIYIYIYIYARQRTQECVSVVMCASCRHSGTDKNSRDSGGRPGKEIKCSWLSGETV
jgi:hypothetical protein